MMMFLPRCLRCCKQGDPWSNGSRCPDINPGTADDTAEQCRSTRRSSGYIHCKQFPVRNVS
jgi:hypothetical protein